MTNFTPSILVQSQIPLYIRENNPLFTKFLEYYYEFVEESKIQSIIQDIQEYIDPDRVDEEFLNTFFEEFKIMPRVMSADKRLVAKFIYDLYKSKGTETATKLLFKMLYGEEITVRYPSENILRASVGNWARDTILTVEFNKNALTATPDIIEVTSKFGSFQYAIEFLEYMPGTINTDRLRITTHLTASFVMSTDTISLYSGSDLITTASMIDTPSDINIIDGGADWKVGNLIIFPSPLKTTIAQVKNVDDNGAITNVDIIQHGFGELSDTYTVSPYDNQTSGNFTQPPYISSGTWNSSKATLQIVYAHQVTGTGYFESLDGMLSVPSICLEDNFFYQVFSYVIDSDHQISEFKDTLKIIHPAGVKYFAEMTKQAGLQANISVNRILS